MLTFFKQNKEITLIYLFTDSYALCKSQHSRIVFTQNRDDFSCKNELM